MKKKFLSLCMAFVMLFSLITVQKSNAAEVKSTNAVVLHKVLMDREGFDNPAFPGKTGLNGEAYTGQDLTQQFEQYFGAGTKEIEGVYFALMNEDETKYITANGQETENVEEAIGGLTEATGLRLDVSGLNQTTPKTYKIVELKEKSTYKGDDNELLAAMKAVPVEIILPFVNQDGVQSEVHVYPKNTEEKPEIDKNFAKEVTDAPDTDLKTAPTEYQRQKDTISRQIGSKIPYQVETKIKKDSDYKKLVWSDIMSNGLTFNNDLRVLVNQEELTADNYSLTYDDRGFQLKLNQDGLNKVAQLAKAGEVVIRLEYSATLNEAAVVDVPETNNISLDYDNKPGEESEPTEGQPQDQQISVQKSWSEGVDLSQGLSVVYTLQVKEDDGSYTNVESVVKTGTTADAFNHVFTGLDDTKTYRVVERVGGFTPAYGEFVAGVVTIENKQNDVPPLNPSEPKVETYGKKFVKTNQTGERLAGAEFFVKNNNGEYLALKGADEASEDVLAYEAAEAKYKETVALYNEAVAKEGVTEETVEVTIDGSVYTGKDAIVAQLEVLKNDRDSKFNSSRDNYQWLAQSDNALVLTSNDQGQFEVTGLQAGSYTLVEKTAPKGYAKLTSEVPFQVAKNSYSTNGDIDYVAESGQSDAQEVENKKITIPETGGIGTLIFTLVGISLMAVAVVALKKNNKREIA